MSVVKPYSDLSYATDLIVDVYKITNPIMIAERAKEDLGISLSIHAIADYLDINREDLETANRKQYYQQFNNY